MSKISLGNNVFVYPMPVVLLGAMDGEKANFMAVGWITRVNGSPPMIAVGINKGHYTPGLIRKSKAFSINFPGAGLKDKVDYCGIVSGARADKSGLFGVFFGELKAPMIEECTLSLECKLVQAVELPTHILFIGEIVQSYVDEKYLTDGRPDVQKMEPLLLTMPDNTYWTVGERTGKAWHDGKVLMKK